MNDIMLTSLILASEQPTPYEQDITLIIGGALITGRIISYKNYTKKIPFFDGIQTGLETAEESGKTSDPLRNFIHLIDAKVLNGNTLIPDHDGFLLRIPLAQVQGFSLGRLNVSQN